MTENAALGLTLERPVPVLQVQDVERSIRWYGEILGFQADPFPDRPPYSFAILRRDQAEIMLQHDECETRRDPPAGWSIYLRVNGGQILRLAENIRQRTALARGPERAFYGQVEMELADPDGHLICIAEVLPADADVPQREE